MLIFIFKTGLIIYIHIKSSFRYQSSCADLEGRGSDDLDILGKLKLIKCTW